jgi:phospholipase/lecithinase/hemolysin
MTSASGAFTSFHVFGDSLSCTASNTVVYPQSTNYFGKRYSNGRIWVEVLAQMQGLPFDPTNGNPHSFFGNTSSNLLGQISAYTPATDASNALVVIWVNNADLFYPATDSSPTLAKFNAVITQAQVNHFRAITNLYARGVRTLVMPNVVDISTIPQFNTYTSYTNLFHQAATNYNAAFKSTLDAVKADPNYSDLTIYVPDFYALLTNLLAHPDSYGMTNALYNSGSGLLSIDALSHPGLVNKTLNGPGTNYIFWDPTDPTAKVHNWMASLAQQLISPAKINKLAALNGSNRLDLVNVPVGQNGMVLGATNLAADNWTTNLLFNSTNTAQSVFVPSSGPQQFYKLSFPVVWIWP